MKIIAELGSLLPDSDLEKIHRELIKCGASAVKYQFYSQKELYGYGSEKPCIEFEQLKKIKKICDVIGLEFMCSSFSLNGYKQINEIVDTHKVACSLTFHYPIISYLSKLDKPVMVSFDGNGDIKIVIDILYPNETYIMHCVPEYPAYDLKTDVIDRYREEINGSKLGLSSHCINIDKILQAHLYYDFDAIELHVKTEENLKNPDNNHSLDLFQFERLCELLISNDNNNFDKKHRVRPTAIVSIKAGDVLKFGVNYDFLRPAKAEKIDLECDLTLLEGLAVRTTIKPFEQIKKHHIANDLQTPY